jgi:hypothetical protein
VCVRECVCVCGGVGGGREGYERKNVARGYVTIGS